MDDARTPRAADAAHPVEAVRERAGEQELPGPQHLADRTVAAIVITAEASPELAATVRALDRQDVPVAVLVVSDGAAVDPTAVVAEAAPDAFVARTDDLVGWCAAANHGATLVSGAAWLLFCHDDVAPAPDAVRAMLDAAEAESADLVVPKLVRWTDHERLRSVGFSADRSAKAIARVDSDELDQGQHDFVRTTAAAHSACLLVKATLFAAVGGFDAAMSAPLAVAPKPRRGTSAAEQQRLAQAVAGPERGEDLDLCWRIIAAGGRAIVAPEARVAHAEREHCLGNSSADGEQRPRDPAADAMASLLGRRNRFRTVCTVLRGPSLVRGLIALLFQRLVLLGTDLPFAAVRDLVPRNRIRDLVQRRRHVASIRGKASTAGSHRQVNGKGRRHDNQLEAQLSPSEVTLRRVVTSEVARDSSQALFLAGEALSTGWRRGPIRLISGFLFTAVTALLIGSRHLLAGVPAHGQFVPVSSLGDLLRAYGTTWRSIGTGSVAPSPPGLLIAIALRIIGLGTDRLTSFFATTLLIPIGVVGAARLGAAVARSARERTSHAEQDDQQRSTDHSTGVLSTALCAALYAATPVAANAIRIGSWEALILYASLPWLLQAILTTSRELPGRPSAVGRASWAASAIRVGLPLAVVAAVAPPAAVVVVLSVLVLWLGSAFADNSVLSDDEQRGPIRAIAIVGGAVLVVCALLCAWLLELARTPAMLRGVWTVHEPADLGHVARLTAGATPDGLVGLGGWLGVGLVVASVLTLILVNERRLSWAIRWWGLALAFGCAMWAADRGPVAGWLPSHEVLAVPIALGLVVVVTVGLSGIADDILKASFGWRQIMMVTAVASALITAVPIAWTARKGDWSASTSPARESTAWFADSADEGLFRTVWIGTPSTVDGSGWRLKGQNAGPTADRVHWNLTGVEPATVERSFGGKPRGGTVEVASALQGAFDRSTFRMGSLVAPSAVRYIVISGRTGQASQPIDQMLSGLEQQLDLREVQRDSSTVVFENTTWIPARAVEGVTAFPGAPERPAVAGVLPSGTLRIAETADSGWVLRVDGAEIQQRPAAAASAVGVAFDQPGGRAVLRHEASLVWSLLRWLQIVLWCAVTVAFLLDWSARRRRLDDLVAEIHDGGDSDEQDLDDAWDASLTVDGAFRSDDDLYAEVFEDHVASARRTPGWDDFSLSSQPDDRTDDTNLPDAGAHESLADQLWSEWSKRHGRGESDPVTSDATPADSSQTGKGGRR